MINISQEENYLSVELSKNGAVYRKKTGRGFDILHFFWRCFLQGKDFSLKGEGFNLIENKGSFTQVRKVVSVLNALSAALNIPLYSNGKKVGLLTVSYSNPPTITKRKRIY